MWLIGVTGWLLLVPWVNGGEESQLAGVVPGTGLGESVASGSKHTEQSKVVRGRRWLRWPSPLRTPRVEKLLS